MTGFVVAGTDTDAGKTAFALLFLGSVWRIVSRCRRL